MSDWRNIGANFSRLETKLSLKSNDFSPSQRLKPLLIMYFLQSIGKRLLGFPKLSRISRITRISRILSPLRQRKVYRPAVHVDRCHLHLQGIAQGVTLVGATTDEAEILLVIDIMVVFQVAHRHQTLALAVV